VTKDIINITKSSMPPYEEFIEAIKPLWNTHLLTNMGVYHQELEKELKDYLDVPYFSLMVNGHMSLELVIQSFEFPEGGEIITTPFTFISTTHAIVRNHLIPVFCDVKETDGTIDETKIEELITEKTVAILPVHVYGHVCNAEEIQNIAERHNLKVIYDAAHCFGVTYKGKGIGNFGDASIFSFHATKVYHTIEGGGVSFADPLRYEKLYNLKNFGIRGEERVVDVGSNGKMNEFCAIMGLCNLKRIKGAIEARRERVEYYQKRLLEIKGVEILEGNVNGSRNYAYLPIVLHTTYGKSRNQLYNVLKANDIYARKYFYPLTADQDCYKDKYSGSRIEKARALSERILTLPIYEELRFEEIDKIVNIIMGNSGEK
jgi:dTDP-4-amino-4,6-dideoxygalactose transaminase